MYLPSIQSGNAISIQQMEFIIFIGKEIHNTIGIAINRHTSCVWFGGWCSNRYGLIDFDMISTALQRNCKSNIEINLTNNKIAEIPTYIFIDFPFALIEHLNIQFAFHSFQELNHFACTNAIRAIE